MSKPCTMLAAAEVVDPICLAVKVVEPQDSGCCCCCEMDVAAVPQHICGVFDDALVDGPDDKKVLVSLGLFTIVRLEREVQLLIPVIDYCIPECECITSTENNPCDLFDKLQFPVDEFFPPERGEFDSIDLRKGCCGD